MEENTDGYIIVHVNKWGHSLVSLRPLCRVWNTTALLCARLWDMVSGNEEEEEDLT